MSSAADTWSKRFIDQYTRKLCVEWAKASVANDGLLPEKEFTDEAIAADPYKSYALRMGWIGKKSPRRLNASGWERAVKWLKK